MIWLKLNWLLQNVLLVNRPEYARVVSRNWWLCVLVSLCSLFAPATISAGPQVFAWGGNYFGQTNVPADVSDVVAISAYSGHSLALKRDGRVLSWGGSGDGLDPVPVGLSNVMAVAAGYSHDLALTREGGVVAWGRNRDATSVPSNLTNVAAVSAAGNHNLVLNRDGSLRFWDSRSPGLTNIPAGLRNIVAVSTGDYHSLALRGDGTVVAWADNWYGAQTNVPPNLTNVVAVAAGRNYSLALKSDGTVTAWGYLNVLLTNYLTELSNVVAVAAGEAHCLALKSDGTVFAWGNNFYGETEVPDYLEDVVSVGAGAGHSIALVGQGPPWTDETMMPRVGICGGAVEFYASAAGAHLNYQWRFNEIDVSGATNRWLELTNVQLSQAGLYSVTAKNEFGSATSSGVLKIFPVDVIEDPTSTDTFVGTPVRLQVKVKTENPVYYQWLRDGQTVPECTNDTLYIPSARLSDTGNYSVIISNAYGCMTSSPARVDVGTVVAWGDNTYGQSKVPPGLTNVAAVALTKFNGFAVKSDGTFMRWGGNKQNYTRIQTGRTNLVAVCAGDGSTLLLRNDGSLVEWSQYPEVPPGLSNVVAISAGVTHFLALTAAGRVVTWDGSETNIPAQASNLVAIAAGGYHNLGVKGDGTVIAWGDNGSGQTNVPHGVTHAIAVSAGLWHSLALLSDGTVVGWGYNSEGQTNVPAGLSNVVAIAAGDYHSLALKGDGSVVAWGKKLNGQTTVPLLLTNVGTIAASGEGSMAVIGSGPPRLTAPLAARSGVLAGTIEFYAVAAGERPLKYQWQFNGKDLPGATNALLELNNAQTDQVGSYSVIISNRFGTTVSPSAGLTLSPLRVLSAPASKTSFIGNTAIFEVSVDSSAPVSFQWFYNGIGIENATNRILTIPAVQPEQSGLYSVVISNSYGTATSDPAELFVTPIAAWGATLVGKLMFHTV